MHSKIQYRAAALLWDVLLGGKYPGVNLSTLVAGLFDHGNQFGLPRDFYASLAGDPQANEHFQAQLRLMQNQLNNQLGNTAISPEDEFQLLGDKGTSNLVGASQLLYKTDENGYIFTLQMTRSSLFLQVTLQNPAFVNPFKLDLHLGGNPTEIDPVFPTNQFYMDRGALPVHAVLVKLLEGLVKIADTSVFQITLYNWLHMVRSANPLALKLNFDDGGQPGQITIS